MKVKAKRLEKIFREHSRYLEPTFYIDTGVVKLSYIYGGFFDDNPLIKYLQKCGYRLVEEHFTIDKELFRVTHQTWEKRTVLSKWDHRFMDMTELVASWSKDPSTKCGSVIVNKSHRVVSLGFNGYPHGIADTGLGNRIEKYEKIIHAEVNAILHAKGNLKNMTLYVYPLPPCARCMALIVQSGIKRIVTMKAKGEKLERWKETNKIAFAMANEVNIKIEYMED